MIKKIMYHAYIVSQCSFLLFSTINGAAHEKKDTPSAFNIRLHTDDGQIFNLTPQTVQQYRAILPFLLTNQRQPHHYVRVSLSKTDANTTQTASSSSSSSSSGGNSSSSSSSSSSSGRSSSSSSDNANNHSLMVFPSYVVGSRITLPFINNDGQVIGFVHFGPRTFL